MHRTPRGDIARSAGVVRLVSHFASPATHPPLTRRSPVLAFQGGGWRGAVIRLLRLMSNPVAITSVFNDGYVAEAYEAYRRDPSQVDESWRQFFRFALTVAGGTGDRDAHQWPGCSSTLKAPSCFFWKIS